MKGIASLTIGFALGMAMLPGRAQAQIDTPPPPLMGQPSFHLYSVPGVIAVAGPEPYFACTNTTSANIRVGVEVFGSSGGGPFNDASATSLDLPPGGTTAFRAEIRPPSNRRRCRGKQNLSALPGRRGCV